MANLTAEESKDLLRKTLSALWNAEHRPLVGARLKAAILKAATDAGAEFNERAIGYSGFTDFVSKSGLAAVKFRQGTDALIVPLEQGATLEVDEKEHRQRIRPDLWGAFVSFPQTGEVRGYDPIEDKVVSATGLLPHLKPITPISRDTQIRWREEFINELGTDQNPLASVRRQLTAPGGLGAFSKAITATPGLRPRWSDFLARRVRGVIEDWAREHGIVNVRLGVEPGQSREETPPRERLYALLDRIPVEKLLELRIPLGWLIDTR
jgi:hypothetical protein